MGKVELTGKLSITPSFICNHFHNNDYKIIEVK